MAGRNMNSNTENHMTLLFAKVLSFIKKIKIRWIKFIY